MKYQVLFSLKNNERVFINVVCCSPDGGLKSYGSGEERCGVAVSRAPDS